MPRKVTITLVGALALAMMSGLITLLLWLLFPLDAGAQGVGNSGYVRRYLANFAAWDGTEIFTDVAPSGTPPASGGVLIYNKNFFVADDLNTLYVTISATGDNHDGRRLMLACLVDGVACNSGTGGAGGAPAGWFTALRFDNYNDDYTGTGYGGDGGGGSGDVHDNVVTYTWCTPFETKPGTHNVKIRLASGANPDGDDPAVNNVVFLENVFFYVDGSRVADETNACTEDPVDAEVATEASTTTAPDGTIIDSSTFVPLLEPSTLDLDPAANPHNH
jgi:hypothetical protein